MQIRLTSAQQNALLHEFQSGTRHIIAPFPCSLLERGINAVFDSVEAIIRRVVCHLIRPWRKRTQT
jgi:hypothetical protein